MSKQQVTHGIADGRTHYADDATIQYIADLERRLALAVETLEPFAAIDLLGLQLPEDFGMHVLTARDTLAQLKEPTK